MVEKLVKGPNIILFLCYKLPTCKAAISLCEAKVVFGCKKIDFYLVMCFLFALRVRECLLNIALLESIDFFSKRKAFGKKRGITIP